MDVHQADIIICGGGLAGLSLATRLAEPEYKHLKVIIIDKSSKTENDRTWSFWAKKDQKRYASIYHKSWTKIAFYSDEAEVISNTAPYTYNTIRGIDFYEHCLKIIKASSHIIWVQASILEIDEERESVTVRTDHGLYRASYAYDSIVKKMPSDDHLFVWQHFMGWEITMEEDTFDEDVATFMDFRMDQGQDTRFVYVLPFNKRKALVEATLFSTDLWTEEGYASILKEYIAKHYRSDYKIVNQELGKIPMTTASFAKATPRVIPIGTNSATVKPSSGYAFTRIQQEVDQQASNIKKGIYKAIKPKSKYLAYDKTLLNVLLTKKRTAAHVFSLMFKRNPVARNLKFLDEETSLLEEISIFMTLPFWPFLKAFTSENVLRVPKSKKIRQP